MCIRDRTLLCVTVVSWGGEPDYFMGGKMIYHDAKILCNMDKYNYVGVSSEVVGQSKIDKKTYWIGQKGGKCLVASDGIVAMADCTDVNWFACETAGKTTGETGETGEASEAHTRKPVWSVLLGFVFFLL